MHTDIPIDIIERAASFDDRWPLMPVLSDRPYRVKFWGRDEALFAQALAVASVPHVYRGGENSGSAWFASLAEAKAFRQPDLLVMTVFFGPECTGTCDTNMDGREIATRIAEIHLPDGRRHLLVRDDDVADSEGLRYIWLDGNWSCDCNRSLDQHRDGVTDLGFPLGEDGEPDAPCTPAGSSRPSLRLGWLVLRFRHLVTGAARFEVVTGADGAAMEDEP